MYLPDQTATRSGQLVPLGHYPEPGLHGQLGQLGIFRAIGRAVRRIGRAVGRVVRGVGRAVGRVARYALPAAAVLLPGAAGAAAGVAAQLLPAPRPTAPPRPYLDPEFHPRAPHRVQPDPLHTHQPVTRPYNHVPTPRPAWGEVVDVVAREVLPRVADVEAARAAAEQERRLRPYLDPAFHPRAPHRVQPYRPYLDPRFHPRAAPQPQPPAAPADAALPGWVVPAGAAAAFLALLATRR